MTTAGLAVSVIVPSYRGGRPLRGCVDAILAQDLAAAFEVIVVRSGLGSGAGPGDGESLPADPRLRVLDRRERLSAAAARNLAAADGAGAVLAFTDADAVPARDWLRQLLDASDGLRCCVGGAIENGTPESAAGTAEFLVAFLDLHRRRPVGSAWHGATCNLLIPRELWESHGPFPEDMGGGEDTVLTARLHGEGRFRFAPAAVVTHMNRTRVADVVRHQYEYGRFTPAIATRGQYKLRPLVLYRALAPVAGLGRVASIAVRTAAWARLPPRLALRSAPVVVLSICAWTVGLLCSDRRVVSPAAGVRGSVRRAARRARRRRDARVVR